MVRVYFVDENRFLQDAFMMDQSIEMILDRISGAINVNRELIILFTFDGRVLNEKDQLSNQVIEEDSVLLLFRRDIVEIKFIVERRDFNKFNTYQLPSIPPRGFAFEEYGEFPRPYDRIPQIEATFFTLAQATKRNLEKYFTLKQYYDDVIEALFYRQKASLALLRNIELYYEEIEKMKRSIETQLEDLRYKLFDHKNIFVQAIESLEATKINKGIYEIITDDSYKKFGDRLMDSLCRLTAKKGDIARVWGTIGREIFEVRDSTERAFNTINQMIEQYNDTTYARKEDDFLEKMMICTEYNSFREILDALLNQRISSRKTESVQKLLEAETMLPEFERGKEGCENIIYEMERFEKKITENIKRMANQYSKVVKSTVKWANSLKYSVKEKLTKLEQKSENLSKLTDLLLIPSQLPEACKAAEEEILRRKNAAPRIKELYIKLSQAIISDSIERRQFLKKYGNVLPKNAYPELIQPVMKRKAIRHIIKVHDDELNTDTSSSRKNSINGTSEVQPENLSPEKIIEHYEYEIKKIEASYQIKLKEAKKREKALEADCLKLSKLLERTRNEREQAIATIKSQAKERELIMSSGQGEYNLRQYTLAISQLREREEAFKKVHMEKVNSLKEELARVKSQHERNEKAEKCEKHRIVI
jgi:hypothetical protein